MFDIVAGNQPGAINAAILTSHVKEKNTWKGSAEKLEEYTGETTYLRLHPLLQNLGHNCGKKSTDGGVENTMKDGITVARLHQRRLQDDIILQSIFLHMVYQMYFHHLSRSPN